jgi:hypothetical protein
MDLENKKVLFIAPIFYQYHTEIIKTLESFGAEVNFYPEIKQSLWLRLSQKVSDKLRAYIEKEYRRALLAEIKKDEYDLVFVIRGGYFDPEFLQALKLKLSQSEFVMYQWDSISQNNYLPLLPYFDRVQTFDMKDAKRHEIDYLPLFYTDEYASLKHQKQAKQYDIVFYGAYHSDRLDVVKAVNALCIKHGLVFKSHLYITKLALIRLLVTGVISYKDKYFLKTYPVPTNEIIDTYKRTSAVLDIELFIQDGLTIRTFEVLGAGLKLLTTNENIRQEAFFDDEDIMIIDRENVTVSPNFFKDSQEQGRVDFEQYHINNWLETVLSRVNE